MNTIFTFKLKLNCVFGANNNIVNDNPVKLEKQKHKSKMTTTFHQRKGKNPQR